MATIDDHIRAMRETGALPVMPNERNQRSMGVYYHTLPKVYYDKKQTNPEIFKVLNQIQNTPYLPMKNGVLEANGVKIWSYLTPTSQSNVYDDTYRIDQQRHIENFMEFGRRARHLKSRSNRYFGFDIETLGDINSIGKENGFFMASEISITGHVMKEDGKYHDSKRMVFNRLVAPDKESKKQLKKLIQNFKANPHNFENLSPSLQRTLVDLVRYSTIAEEGMRGAVFGKNVHHSNYIDQILKGKTIQVDELKGRAHYYAKHMENGLKNLSEHGIDPSQAIEEYNAFVQKHNQSFFVTMNGDRFDLPAMQKWGDFLRAQKGTNVLNVAQPKYHLDYQKSMEAILRNPITAHKIFGRPIYLADIDRKKEYMMPFEEGSMTLNEWRKTLGISTSESHAANYDSGIKGVGGLVSQTWEKLYSIVEGSNVVDHKKMKRKIGQRSPYLKFDKTPLTINDTLFSTRAIQNYTPHALDHQALVDENGNYTFYKPDFNKNVINAESYYKPVGLRKLDDPDSKTTRIALELMDINDEKLRTFIVREGEHAIYEIADFLHRGMEPTNRYSSSLSKKIYNSNLEDKSRRRYEGLFDTNSSATRGFEAAKRMYKNAAIYQQRLNGSWKNIYDEAVKKTTENVRVMQEKFGRNLTQEEINDMRYTVIGRLLKKRISHEEMIDQMDFNSEWDALQKKFVHNHTEEEQFWKMAPRMLSELPFYQQAIEAIEANIEDPKIRDIAWSMFHQEVNETFGAHRTTRKRLPYEEQGFKYFDRLSGKSMTVNTSNPNEVINKFMGIIYKDTKDLDNAEKNQLARERFKTTLASLQDSGIIKQDYVKQILNEHYNMNLSIPDSVQKLSLDLIDQGHRMLDDIETTSLQKRTQVENISKDLANQIISSTIKRAKGFQGYLIREGEIVKPDLYQGDLNRFFHELDKQHAVTQLMPNNRGAVEKIIGHYMNINPDLHAHLGINKAGTEAILTMFHKDDAHSVLRHIHSGATEAHAKSFEVRIPLVTRQGTISYGNVHMNAVTDIVLRDGKFIPRSSVEKLADLLTDPSFMDSNGLYDYKQIQKDLKEGKLEDATKRVRRSIRTTLQDLSGIKRDFNNSLKYDGTEADISKQSRVYVDSAMIQDYYQKGLLTDKDFANQDVIINSEKKILHPSVNLGDLWADGKHKIRVNMAKWAKENGIGNLYFSNVKGDVVIDGGASRIDARDLLPFGHMTNQGRDNAVQMQNTRRITDEIEERLNQVGAYTNLNDMTITRLKQTYDQRLGFKREVNVKTAYMSQADIDARIQALMETSEGQELLRREGILLDNGQFSAARYPSVYEQQALLHEDLITAFQTHDYKFNRGDAFEFHSSLYDKNTGEFIKRELKPGVVIGWRTENGRREIVRWEQKHIGTIVSDPNDPNVAIRYNEDAVKFHLDIEKLTPSGGNRGFSSEFLEALTGIEGIGVIYNPDIGKHEDFGAVLRAQANKIHAYVNAMSEVDRQRAFDMINKARIGVKAEQYEDSFHFLDTSANYKKGINVNNFYRLFDKLNQEFADRYGTIEESKNIQIGDVYFKTTWGIQSLRASSVVNYATMVDEKRRSILDYDIDENGELTNIQYGSEVKGVKYGPRELGVLRRAGLENVRRYVIDEMKNSAVETGRLNEALGMIQSIGGLAYGPEKMDNHVNARTMRVEDFERLPVEDSNKVSLRHTVLDSDYIEQKLGHTRGFWLELPKIHVNDREDPLSIKYDGKEIDKLFIPSTRIEGKGNEAWKRDLQRQIATIYNKAAAATNAVDPKEKYKAHGELQSAVNDYAKFLVGNASSSKGQIGEMLKVNMPYSSSGMTKVLPISISSQLEGETTFISPDEAKALGVYDHIMSGKDFYAPDLRYPTFTDKAIQIVKLKIDPNAQTGYHNVSSLAASFLNADSDGDYNHILAIHSDAAQKEMAARYQQQVHERLKRHEIAYQKATAQADLYSAEFIETQAKDVQRSYTMESLANDHGYFEPTKINSTGEMLAKTGKELVGQASDLNYFMRQLAERYLPHDRKAREAIEAFGEGLEQKLTISAKHVKDGDMQFETRAGAAEFLNALRNSQFDKIKELDKNYFGNMFANDWQMDEALYHLQSIQSKMKADMLKNNALRFGTSTGVKLEENGENLQEIANFIFRKSPQGNSASEHLNLIHEIMQDADMLEQLDMPVLQEEYRPIKEPLNILESTPSKKRLGGFKGLVADAFEDLTGGIFKQATYDKFRDTLKNIFDGPKGGRNKMIAAGAGLALAGLMGYNTFKNEPLVPTSLPETTQASSSADHGSTPQPAIGPVDDRGVGGGAHITISAKGKGQNPNSFSSMVGEGITRSNYSCGRIHMSINHSDNTAQLNRIWYRDKVDQYT